MHVVRSPFSDYLRYECEWGYAYNSTVGEEIRILDLSEQTRPNDLIDEDFWLIGDDRGIQMHYDDAGKYLGAEIANDDLAQRYRAARDAAWSSAVPFADYWKEHPQYWRDHPAA